MLDYESYIVKPERLHGILKDRGELVTRFGQPEQVTTNLVSPWLKK